MLSSVKFFVALLSYVTAVRFVAWENLPAGFGLPNNQTIVSTCPTSTPQVDVVLAQGQCFTFPTYAQNCNGYGVVFAGPTPAKSGKMYSYPASDPKCQIFVSNITQPQPCVQFEFFEPEDCTGGVRLTTTQFFGKCACSSCLDQTQVQCQNWYDVNPTTTAPANTASPDATSATVVIVLSFAPTSEQIQQIIAVLVELTGLPSSSFQIVILSSRSFFAVRSATVRVSVSGTGAGAGANLIASTLTSDPSYLATKTAGLPTVQSATISAASILFVNMSILLCLIVIVCSLLF